MDNSGDDPKKQLPIKTGKSAKNLAEILAALYDLGLSFSYDVFSHTPIVKGIDEFDGAISDAALGEIWFRLHERLPKKVPSQKALLDIILIQAQHKRVHPVLQRLDKFTCDGVPRIDTWLTTYLGAEDTPLTREIGRIVLIAAVRRLRRPGIKFDFTLILEGKQGVGKSSAVRALALKREWFSDSFPPFDNEQRQIEALLGKWIVEYPELSGLRKSEQERVKAFLSRQTDRARLAYARLPIEVHRQCVFIGTTNDSEYLLDLTGNRRFWPVKVGTIDLEALNRDVKLLWAEAAVAEALDESIELRAELWQQAIEAQTERVRLPAWYDEIQGLIGHYTEGAIPAKTIWEALKIDIKDRPRLSRDLGAAMNAVGFEREQIGSDCHGAKRGQRVYVKNPRGSLIANLPTIRLWEGM